jgi:hypothetical protein
MTSLSHVTALRTRLQHTCCRLVIYLHPNLDIVCSKLRQQQAPQTHRRFCCLCQVREERKTGMCTSNR